MCVSRLVLRTKTRVRPPTCPQHLTCQHFFLYPLCTPTKYCVGAGYAGDGYSCHETSFGLVAIKAYSGDYTWFDAKNKCYEDGANGVQGELPSPRSYIENKWFVDKADELGLGGFWLGVNDEDEKGVWMNGYGMRQNYSNWAPGEPRLSDDKNCVNVGPGTWGGDYAWDDVSCGHSWGLLCTYVTGQSRNC